MNLGRLADWFIHPTYFEDALTLRRARLLVRACLLTSIFSISYVALSFYFHYERAIYFTAFNVIGYFFYPFLVRTKLSLNVLANIFPSIGAITVLVLTWFSGGMWSAIYPWIIAIPVLALLVVGRTPAIYWSVFSFLCMVGFGVLEFKGIQLPVEYNIAMRTLWYISIIPGLLLIIMVVSFTFEYSMQRALHDVETQKVTIEKQSIVLEKLIEDKDHIIRILAHDLKNPLANISLLVKLLEKETLQGESKELVNMIGNASANAQILVRHVLEMATLEYNDSGLKLIPTDVYLLLTEVVQSFKQTSENKKIAIQIEPVNSTCSVITNDTYLRSVFENLLSNAIKFSPSETEVRISFAESQKHIQIRVKDSGPGVPEEEELHLFKKFSRLSARPTAGESSNGLGLSLVKRYMELMNGKVWFERPSQGGSIFAIELMKA